MLNRYSTFLCWVLELVVASDRVDFVPAVLGQSLDNVARRIRFHRFVLLKHSIIANIIVFVNKLDEYFSMRYILQIQEV